MSDDKKLAHMRNAGFDLRLEMLLFLLVEIIYEWQEPQLGHDFTIHLHCCGQAKKKQTKNWYISTVDGVTEEVGFIMIDLKGNEELKLDVPFLGKVEVQHLVRNGYFTLIKEKLSKISNKIQIRKDKCKRVKFQPILTKKRCNSILFLSYVAIKLKELSIATQRMFQEDDDLNYNGCVSIHQLLTKEPKLINKIIDNGSVPQLLEQHTCCCKELNKNFFGVAPLVELVESTRNESILEQVLWALGTISGNSVVCRNIVLKAGGLDKVISRLSYIQKTINQPRTPLMRCACRCVSQFCCGRPRPYRPVAEKCIKALIPFFDSRDEETLQHTASAFSWLTESDDNMRCDEENENNWTMSDITNDNGYLSLVRSCGAFPKLVNLLGHPSFAVTHSCLMAIGNMLLGTSQQTKDILECEVLTKLMHLLKSKNVKVRKEVCWVLSNVTADGPIHIDYVIKAELIQPLIHLLKTDKRIIQIEAAWALGNATALGSSKQIHYLLKQGLLEAMIVFRDSIASQKKKEEFMEEKDDNENLVKSFLYGNYYFLFILIIFFCLFVRNEQFEKPVPRGVHQLVEDTIEILKNRNSNHNVI
ncbi:importin alpha [Reticulomyxa filosa]|uniref:Importin alpha n=1 Tax=Reticulomyxa filosa TaxID=46433 RepID=X6MNX4_RETFI|nr:importin alpha [Reticulomyxa filosa]|eukprot:ETO14780.1 importin alpha [Reticulomyxa filosa]